jgi:hypothetical protein
MNSGLGNAKLVCTRWTMGTFRSLKRRSGMTRVTVLLIVAALAIATTACDSSRTYELSISSTSGGSVTVPREGTFTCDAGTVVELVATADAGYKFHAWTGDTEAIADPASAATTITVNGNYFITANFGPTGAHGQSTP